MKKSFTQKPLARLIGLSLLSGAFVTPVALSAEVALEEVTVTAQRREESLQETPIAVTAFSEADMDDLGITDISNVSASTPNLQIQPTIGGSVNAAITIRGMGLSSNNLSRDSSVGVYLDGVSIGKTSGAIFDAVDLERIEVLRGPQGTLYGKNTIAGAMNLVAQKPTGEFGAKVKVGLGNENLQTFRTSIDFDSIGAVNEGLGALSSRVTYFRTKRDGFFDNDGPSSSDFDNKNQWGVRAAFRLDVTDNLSIDYAYDDFTLDQNTPMLSSPMKDRPDSIANDSAELSIVDTDGHSLHVTYDMGETALGNVTFKSITAKREIHTDSHSDFDGSTFDGLRFQNDNTYEQTSQEFQFIGTGERVTWVAGLYYMEDEWHTVNPRWIYTGLGYPGGADTDNRGGDDTSEAAYGQLTWTPDAFDDRLDLTFGVRYTKEEKDVYRLRINESAFAPVKYATDPCNAGSGVFSRDAAGCPILDANGVPKATSFKEDWSQTTPMFVASWQLTEDVNIYGKVVTGFKSGGVNGVAVTESSFATPFDAEEVTTYELGLKSRFWDNRIQVNAAYFLNDFTDIHVNTQVLNVLGIVVDNAGEATIQGAELEVKALMSENLELGFNLGVIDPEYDEYIDNGVEVKNDRVFSNTPETNYSAMVKYTFDPMSIGTLSARVDYSYRDDFYLTVTKSTSTPSLDPDDVSLLQARISLEEIPLGNGSLKLSAWGKNLTDEEYWDVALSSTNSQQWADPRSYGLEATYEF